MIDRGLLRQVRTPVYTSDGICKRLLYIAASLYGAEALFLCEEMPVTREENPDVE